jgi:predicted secreted protein
MVTGNIDRIVPIHKQFVIELEAIPGAGYTWELTRHPEEIRLVSRKFISTSKSVGGTSIQRFTLVAIQPGIYSLGFEYKRRWEKSSVSTSEFMIQAQ